VYIAHTAIKALRAPIRAIGSRASGRAVRVDIPPEREREKVPAEDGEEAHVPPVLGEVREAEPLDRERRQQPEVAPVREPETRACNPQPAHVLRREEEQLRDDEERGDEHGAVRAWTMRARLGCVRGEPDEYASGEVRERDRRDLGGLECRGGDGVVGRVVLGEERLGDEADIINIC